MTAYEVCMDYFKKNLGIRKYKTNELKCVFGASIAAGVSGSLITNFLEVIVIRKQAETNEKVRDIMKE